MKTCFFNLAAIVLLISLAGMGTSGCAAGQPKASAPARVIDLTEVGVAAPHGDPLPTPGSTRTIVPWDDAAIHTVLPANDPMAGALVVLYGKSWKIDDGDAHLVYLLESPGPDIEPVSLQWKPNADGQLHAFARVNGQLRSYDFDR